MTLPWFQRPVDWLRSAAASARDRAPMAGNQRPGLMMLGVLALAAAVLVPLQIAGAAQSDDLDQNFDTMFAGKPVRVALPPHQPARQARAADQATAGAQGWRASPTPLAVPPYLAADAPSAPLLAAGSPATRGAGPFADGYAAQFNRQGLGGAGTPLERRLAALAESSRGRIGVAALDLVSGRSVAVMGDQPFPLASTVKVAIVATFLADVDAGRLHLGDRFPMMVPLPSAKLSSAVAPARAGTWLPAQELIERAITLSDNHATDGLLVAIGGPQAVDHWLRGAGLIGMRIDHNINTLVRDDGVINPATTVDVHDSTTPSTMVRLLAGLYQGNWLSPASREVLLGAMSRCRTGVHRMRLLLPDEALIGHKTGTLANTSSDVGFIRSPEGHPVALAIYVTGQRGKPERESRIANIARAVYDGYAAELGNAALPQTP